MDVDLQDPWRAYKLRWKRRRLLWRAFQKRRELSCVTDRTNELPSDAILAFSTVRNEITRLPFFLAHHRQLGVAHFLIVDNGSDDGTSEYLAQQDDVSVWRTDHSYKGSRFGMDWLNWLLRSHGHGRWCLTLDVDECLIYPHWGERGLKELTKWLAANKAECFAAVMLDLYPKGPIGSVPYRAGQNPTEALAWYDADTYTYERLAKFSNISVRGGPRKRMFFADTPDHAPHLDKTPLIFWHRSYAYLSSMHIALPRRLNRGLDARLGLPSGVLLHSKFLPEVIEKSSSEKHRAEHFTHSERYGDYYDHITQQPDLWCETSAHYRGWEDMVQQGLMFGGKWLQ
ncbi:glycosyltransferase family 2 protein [Nereida sp. MMG025]|uniref:glycosyltransferase family 2 protein n=1 Tax=Nereida sp. MMG025 TaxID=2909981 RepID=UPI001F401B4A|nr:glycosyltransferase family 2 protein [Nereida sp. MMG025]MCF6444556.1 glycosyltransferase family 2 protein [Nereida sp. MMG025]